MKNNKGITLTSLIIYIAVIFVVIAALMRITTYFSSNMQDAADVSFETEFNKLNLYLLDEAKTVGNGIGVISEDGTQITFTNGNTYLYNAEDKVVYLNGTIKICENVESCVFEKQVANNGKNILKLTIKINSIEKIANYVIINKNGEQTIIAEEDYIFDIGGETEGEIQQPLLPAQYQQVEYIKSSGTQYINTEYLPDSNTNAKYKVSISSFATYGPHVLSSNKYFFPLLRGNKDILAYRGSEQFSTSIIPEVNKIYEIEAFWNGKIIINGQEIGELTSTGAADTTPLYLGTYGGAPSTSIYILNGKIYYCKIYNGEELVRDMVPCYRISDNVVGMYDTVNDVFYTNVGTGTFDKGANVN